MRILVVGAGALGGYFGGRLLAAGRDVTFLVRPGRAAQIAASGGLTLVYPGGEIRLPDPPLVLAKDLAGDFDLVFLACKATALESCIADMAPAVGAGTMILPVLNGLRHIDMLAERFGRERVLGGRSFIFATLDEAGRAVNQGDLATIDFGELDGGESARTRAVLVALSDAGFKATLNADIVRGMWEKWVMISTVAGATCLMRAALGDIVRAGALPFSLALARECAAIAAANGHAPSEQHMATIEKTVSNSESTQSASMHKDMEKGLPIEADHVIGDLLARVPAGREDDYPLLRLVYWHLKAYEARRARETGA